MRRSKHKLTPFSLSFLDIMSCGFGAVVLLFLIIKHNVDAAIPAPVRPPDSSTEVSLLTQEIRVEQEELTEIQATLASLDQQIAATVARTIRLRQATAASTGQTEALTAPAQTTEIDALKTKIVKLEQDVNQLQEKRQAAGKSARTFVGKGEREYVSGLKLGGKRILVLLDSSASMLDDTIVNIIRRRNMSDRVKRRAKKWRQAVRMVDWLSARFPVSSQYQLYTFNTDVKAAHSGSKGRWLRVNDKQQLNTSIAALSQQIPAGGTNLENAFIAAAGLRPLPDNIFLITDSLPTQGRTASRRATVTGAQRLKLFEAAIKRLPPKVPVNVILAPMEGDPLAAAAFWRLAQFTQGSFLSPSADWP